MRSEGSPRQLNKANSLVKDFLLPVKQAREVVCERRFPAENANFRRRTPFGHEKTPFADRQRRLAMSKHRSPTANNVWSRENAVWP
jgi:hypothetical protein